MSLHVFVDEAKRDGYLLCAAVVPTADLVQARRVMRDLKPGNRRRLHMHDESPGSRRRILSDFVRRAPIAAAHVWRAPIAGRAERAVRDDCVRALVRDVTAIGATRLVVESCAQDVQDARVIAGALAGQNLIGTVRFDIVAPSADPLLWAADLIVWAFAAGGQARRAIADLVTVHEVGL